MTILLEGGLDWPLAPGWPLPDTLSADQATAAEQCAVDWLWNLSGRQFGTWQALVRPQTRLLNLRWDLLPSFLQNIYGPLWGRGWPYSGDPRYDGLGVKQVMELEGPVVPPTEDAPVLVDIYDPDTGDHTALASNDTGPGLPAFRVEGNYLVRQDGGIWPETQNLIAALGSKNTWAVTYQRGTPVPYSGQVAAAILAVEFGKQFLGDKSCRIPYNATTVTRAGVTVNRDVLKAAVTSGVREVDQFVAQTNPNGLMQPPQIWSPDTARNARPYAGSYAPTTLG